MGLLTRNREEAPCTVEGRHRFESLHAHVRFDNGAVVHPGDEVLVHGAPVMAAYGEVVIEERMATITRASLARAALDPADRRSRVHGALRILVLRGGEAMNMRADLTPTDARDQGEPRR